MVFDAARGRAVLFGGQGTNLLADTWEWDGKEWTELADTGPAARWGHGVAFDSKRQRVVLFGGEDFGDYFGDTWVWDGDEWTQEQDSGPSSRFINTLAYDAIRDRRRAPRIESSTTAQRCSSSGVLEVSSSLAIPGSGMGTIGRNCRTSALHPEQVLVWRSIPSVSTQYSLEV